MEARSLVPAEIVPASRRMTAADAGKLLAGRTRLVVARGAKWEELALPAGDRAGLVERMLGPTGNLRAPTAIVGKTVLVGFNEEAWSSVFD